MRRRNILEQLPELIPEAPFEKNTFNLGYLPQRRETRGRKCRLEFRPPACFAVTKKPFRDTGPPPQSCLKSHLIFFKLSASSFHARTSATNVCLSCAYVTYTSCTSHLQNTSKQVLRHCQTFSSKRIISTELLKLISASPTFLFLGTSAVLLLHHLPLRTVK